MVRRRWPVAAVLATLLVTACGSSGGGSSATTAATPPTSTTATTAATTAVTTATTAPTLHLVPTTLPVITLPPGATVPAHPVTSAPKPSTPKTQCLAAPAPPAGAASLQTLTGDIDGDGNADTVWLDDLADGPHLQIHAARGATADQPLGFGKSTVSLGFAQVDFAPGTAEPGIEEEILAVASQSDGTRLAGLYGYVEATGCLDLFKFGSGAPFVYLISRTGTLSGLRCLSDGRSAHLEGLTATPLSPTTYQARAIVLGTGDSRILSPALTSTTTLTLPRDGGERGGGFDDHRPHRSPAPVD